MLRFERDVAAPDDWQTIERRREESADTPASITADPRPRVGLWLWYVGPSEA